MSTSKKVKKFYESNYVGYDKYMEKTEHYAAQIKILKLITNEIKEPILDLACGGGILISFLSKKFSKIYGNDFSKNMIEIAKKRNPFILFTNENAEILKSYNKKFNTIFCCNLFFYIQNKGKAITKWKELLDKNGKLIVIEEYPFVQPKTLLLDKSEKEFTNLIKPLSPKQIIKTLEERGLLLIKKVEITIDKKHKLYGLLFLKKT